MKWWVYFRLLPPLCVAIALIAFGRGAHYWNLSAAGWFTAFAFHFAGWARLKQLRLLDAATFYLYLLFLAPVFEIAQSGVPRSAWVIWACFMYGVYLFMTGIVWTTAMKSDPESTSRQESE